MIQKNFLKSVAFTAFLIIGPNTSPSLACSTEVLTYSGRIGAETEQVDITLPSVNNYSQVVVRLTRVSDRSFATEVKNSGMPENVAGKDSFVSTGVHLSFDDEYRQVVVPILSVQPNSPDYETSRSFVTITFAAVSIVPGASSALELSSYRHHFSECFRQGQEDALNANGGVNNVLTIRGVADIPGLDRLTDEDLASLSNESTESK